MVKRLTRILSLVLTLVLAVTAFDITPIGAAEAKAEGTRGGNDVPAAEELLSLGEWRYWVDGGLAYIAGYANPDETSLNIPHSLGGYPVAGVGHEAFSQNTGLKRVFMHTNVTRIADDAFSGLSGVTISAYHGAYALDYASARQGLTANTITENATFEDGVIDLTGVNAGSYRALSDYSVVFTAAEATFLAVGQVVYFPAQSGYPTGLAARIDSIAQSGGELNVTMSKPSFDEVFTSFSGAGDLYLDWDNAIYYEGVTPIDDGDESKGIIHDVYNLKPGSRKATKSLSLNFKLNDKLTLSGTLTTTVTAEINLTVERWLTWMSLSKGTLKLTTENTLSASLKYKNNLVETEMGGKEEWRRYVDGAGTLHKETVAAVPFASAYGFTGYLSIEVVYELSGALTITYSTKKTEIYTLQNGKINKESISSAPGLTISLEAKLKIGPKLTLGFEWGIANLCTIRFFEASVGVFFEATGRTTYTYIHSGITSGLICLDITYEVYIQFEIKFGFVDIKFFGKKIPFDAALSTTYKISLQKQTRNHFDGYSVGSMAKGLLMSAFLKVNNCNLLGRDVKFVYDNGTSDKKVQYNVNDIINSPGADPKKSGYIFQGWYIDAKSSGLSGDDRPVLFGSTTMPFLKPGTALVIKAKWKKYDPVTSLTLNKTSITGYSNDSGSTKLSVTVNPSNATNKAVKWSSSNTNVATVASDGTVKLKNAGTATITCTSVDKPAVKATCSVTVNQSVTGISMNTPSISRYSDNMGTVQLNATVSPSNAANKALTWSSSNNNVATVSSSGLVTLKGVGTAVITCASVSNPSVIARCNVNVMQAVTGISLNTTSVNGYSYAKQTATLQPTVSPSNAANKAVTWSTSDPSVVTVSGDGILSFKGVGTATITCTSVSQPYVKTTCAVTVRQSVTELALDRDSISRWSDDPDKTVQLNVTVIPDNAADKSLVWSSSDTSVATVSNTGLVTLKKSGTATISCQSVSNPNVVAKCAVTIWQAVEGLALDKTTVERTKDEPGTVKLNVTVSPSNAFNKNVTWTSSAPGVASVTADGVVTVHNVGTAVITATSVSTPGKTASCTFTIEHSVTGMSLDRTGITRYSSETGTVKLTETLEAVEVANRAVIWTSSNENVATVSDTGVVTITGVGDATITCTSVSNPDVSATCSVHIMQSVTAIVLGQTEAIAFTNRNDGLQLTPDIQPADAANKALVWTSSDVSVVTVSDSGLVTVVAPGVATVTVRSVSDPHVTAACQVTVKQGVTSVTLNESGINGYSSDTEPILLTYKTQPSDAYDRSVTWTSSNPAVVTVSDTGVLTIHGAGTATITCASHSNPAVTASCDVTIRQAVDSITLSQTTIACQNADTAPIQLTATVLPANAANRDVIWTSSNENVATVTDTGLVTIVGTGTANITCTSVISPAVKATCQVGVNQAVYALTLNDHAVTCFDDETDQILLTAVVQPGIAYDKSVTWTSSDPSVATVSQSGAVTINSAGTATITCASVSSPSVKDTCVFTVKRAIHGIALNESAITLHADDEAGQQLVATLPPANAEESGLAWTSSNQDVAIVTDGGVVIPVGVGTATITCANIRNSAVKATCAVTVSARVSAIVVEGDADSFMPGETIQLSAECYPSNAADRAVVWSSSDSQVATVDNSGLVTAVGYGNATIYAASHDNPEIVTGFDVTVERELALETVVENDTIYLQGEAESKLGQVGASVTSAARMARLGNTLTWSLKNNPAGVRLETVDTTVSEGGQTYQTTYAVLYDDGIATAGQKSYTVVCTAGNYTAEAVIGLTVDGGEYTQSAAIVPPVFTVGEGEPVQLPAAPSGQDGKPVPAGIAISGVDGDRGYNLHASEALTEDGLEVSFDESGVYAATVIYRASNLTYEVPVSFEVTDGQGHVHYPAESLTLSQDYAAMVEGDTLALTCEVGPSNAYNKDVTWTSSNEDVVTVDANGRVTAVGVGSAAVVCTAADGSGVSDMCAVTVESFLQLDEAEMEFTVYTGGDSHADLGIVNVTIASEQRIVDADLNVTWTLEKKSGAASELAMSEFRGALEQGVTVSGNQLKLMRVNGAGTDKYLLTCRAGDYTARCDVTVNVLSGALPESVALNTSIYSGQVGEFIEINPAYACQPTGSELPEGVRISVEGGRAFEDALSTLYDFEEPCNLIFEKGGTYRANVVFSGDNFRFACPITVAVKDETGLVPQNVTDVIVPGDSVYLSVGETAALTAEIVPANVSHSAVTWTTSDNAVATVSSQGVVTAIGEGVAFIAASVTECESSGGVMVVVESGLTLQSEGVERTIFLDGDTRWQLDTVQLTPSSSLRLNGEAPKWTLSRVSGNNLTLKLADYQAADASGNPLYGCGITLYSVSREGDTTYELRCEAGGETATIPVVVHAVRRDRTLPASLALSQAVFEAGVDELIKLEPQITCLPEGTRLPDGIRVEIKGDALFDNAVNTEDFYVSQSLSTLSFNRAGLFPATMFYSYSNMRYAVPVTFRVHDGAGNVPVLGSAVTLSDKALWLQPGETETLKAVFTPAETDDQAVTWSSGNTAVATVDASGVVSAVSKGKATIVCRPHDSYLPTLSCVVTVEDYLTVESGNSEVSLYKQGEQVCELPGAWLSAGTILRLKKAGEKPVWSLVRVSGEHTELEMTESADGDAVTVTTTALLSGGQDVYRIGCSAAGREWTHDFTVNVIDAANAPESIEVASGTVNAAVGETVTIDFTPVCVPAGSVMPQSDDMWDIYAGVGQAFYDALNGDVYEAEGNTAVVSFTKPGAYMLTRQFFINNIHYAEVCRIVVGQANEPFGFLSADTTEATVYLGGQSGTAASVTVCDPILEDVFAGRMSWTLEHISGDSTVVSLKERDQGVDLFVASATKAGEDVWRVTCAFGDDSSAVDVTITVEQPRGAVPERVSLTQNSLSGMTGDWLSMPIGVVCEPAGSALPESGDDFWRFEPVGVAGDVCEWTIENGRLSVRVLRAGYYSGELIYRAGNFHYELPVYMAVTDEEGVLNTPNMNVYLLKAADTVYGGGVTGVPVAVAALSEGLAAYYAGTGPAYLASHDAAWSLSVVSGTAATLSMRKAGDGAVEILLDTIKGAGSGGRPPVSGGADADHRDRRRRDARSDPGPRHLLRRGGRGAGHPAHGLRQGLRLHPAERVQLGYRRLPVGDRL